MDYINLLTSIGLSMLFLGLSLMVQSRILRSSDVELPSLGRTLKKLSYAIFMPLGIIFLVVGIWLGYNIPLISLGVMLVLLAVAFIAQGQALHIPQSALAKLGQNIKVYAWVYAIIGFSAVMAVSAVTIYLFLLA